MHIGWCFSKATKVRLMRDPETKRRLMAVSDGQSDCDCVVGSDQSSGVRWRGAVHIFCYMAKSEDPWHFARPELARQYLDFFETGVSNALILFQRRRYGKTEFCLRDLAPEAEARGYRVAYASLWQSRLSAAAVLLHAIEKTRERAGVAERVREFLTISIPASEDLRTAKGNGGLSK